MLLLQATQLPQLCKKQQYWLAQVQYKLHNCHNYVRSNNILANSGTVLSLTYQVIIICIIISLSEALCSSSTMASLTFQCQIIILFLKNPLLKYKIFQIIIKEYLVSFFFFDFFKFLGMQIFNISENNI
jgi:hypothetical protein